MWLGMRPRALLGILILASSYFAPNCRAAFEIEAAGPAERGAATAMALGMAAGSLDPQSLAAFGNVVAGAVHGDSLCPGDSGLREVSVYGLKPFGLDGLEFTSLSVATSRSGRVRGIGLSYRRLAALSYLEQTWAASVTLGCERASVAPCLRLGAVQAGSGFQDQAVVADIAATSQVTRVLRIAVALENPLALGLFREGSRVPQRLKVGLGVLVCESLGFGAEVTKESRFPVCVASGVEWTPSKGLFLRSGVRTCPREAAFGVGYHRGAVAVDLSSTINADLGTTHAAGVTLMWR